MECLIPTLLKMFANWFVATLEVLLQLELKPFHLMTYWHCLLNMSPVELLNFYHHVWFPLFHFIRSYSYLSDYSIQKPNADPGFFFFPNFPYSTNWFCPQYLQDIQTFISSSAVTTLFGAIFFPSWYLNSHPTHISGLTLLISTPSPESSKSDFLKKWKLDHFIPLSKIPFIYALAISSYRNTLCSFSS